MEAYSVRPCFTTCSDLKPAHRIHPCLGNSLRQFPNGQRSDRSLAASSLKIHARESTVGPKLSADVFGGAVNTEIRLHHYALGSFQLRLGAIFKAVGTASPRNVFLLIRTQPPVSHRRLNAVKGSNRTAPSAQPLTCSRLRMHLARPRFGPAGVSGTR